VSNDAPCQSLIPMVGSSLENGDMGGIIMAEAWTNHLNSSKSLLCMQALGFHVNGRF